MRKIDLAEFTIALKKRPLGNCSINFALRRVREILNNARDRFEGHLSFKPPKIRFEPEAELKNELSGTEQARFLGAFDDHNGFERYLRDRQRGRVLAFGGSGNNPTGVNFKPDGEAVAFYFQRFQRSKAVYVAALHTGLRKSDLLDLRWDAIALEQGLISVRMAKTNKWVGVPISNILHAVLTEERGRTVAALTDHVFLTEEGKPYSDKVIRKYFAVAKAMAGITRRVRLHDLRHTFASNLASRGLSSFVLRDMLGHTTTKQTERYARLSPAISESVRAALDGEEMPKAGRDGHFAGHSGDDSTTVLFPSKSNK